MAKKLFHVQGIVDFSILHELMLLLDGKSMDMQYRPVRHGGEDENGAIKSMPTGREFLKMYLEKHPHFKMRDLADAAVEMGVRKEVVTQAVHVFYREGLLQRTAPAEYRLMGAKRKSTKGMRLGGGKTVASTIADIVRRKQNGSGEGVNIQVIKDELKKLDIATTGTSPAIASLMKKKLIKRVAPAHYRVEA